ncbi:MAG: tandem-95 repeat protein [Coriobacteriia bacterium]|nr:tandem-95 repeat protein [Coriobacteriia bacterium]
MRPRRSAAAVLVLVLTTVLVLAWAPVAFAANIYVSATFGDDVTGDGSGSLPFATIGAGLAHAAIGDTVQVDGGVYTEDLDLREGIIVRGAGAGITHVIGTGTRSVVRAYGLTSATLRDVDLRGGLSEYGGGIDCANSALTLVGVAVEECTATAGGGGMSAREATVALTLCWFGSNETTGSGGGAYLATSTATFQSCTALSNNAKGGAGGGIFALVSDMTLADCLLAGNFAYFGSGLTIIGGSAVVADSAVRDSVSMGAGGILVDGASLALTRTTIERNTGFGGGGGIEATVSVVSLTDCSVVENGAFFSGGGIRATSSSLTISGSTVASNTAKFANGGGLSVTDSTLLASASVVSSNSVLGFGEGGGLAAQASTMTLDDCNFQANGAFIAGGGMKIAESIVAMNGGRIAGNSSYFSGGGLHASLSDLTISGSVIASNAVTLGTGGGLDVTTSTVRATSSVICSNTAGLGGGGGLNLNETTATLDGCAVLGNYAFAYSGGIMARSSRVSLTASTVEGNSAMLGTGGIHVQMSELMVAGSTVASNAGQFGCGGVYAATSTVDVSASTISSNTGGLSGGGGLYSRVATVTLTDSRVNGNQGWLGGGVLVLDSRLAARGVTVSGNTVALGGAGILVSGSEFSLDGSTVTSNTAAMSGGGVSVSYSNVRIGSSVISSNCVTSIGDGGGMSSYGATVTLSDCLLLGNDAVGSGGGLSARESRVTMVRSSASGNSAVYFGGGVSAEASDLSLTDGVLDSNTVQLSGGGLYATTSTVQASSVVISSNSAVLGGAGGGVASNDATMALSDCTVRDNHAFSGGGVEAWGSHMTVTGGSVTRNSSDFHGGGIGANATDLEISGSIVATNTSVFMGGGVAAADGTALLEHVTMRGNSSMVGGGLSLVEADAAVSTCTIAGNTAGAGGGVYVRGLSSVFRSSTFDGNSATWPDLDAVEVKGGGIYVTEAVPTFDGCSFTGNTSAEGGGGSYCASSTPTFVNCVLAGNESGGPGGAALTATSTATFTNCTVADNLADGASGINAVNGNATVTNSILWDNGFQTNGGMVGCNVTYSDVDTGSGGLGNISADPLFVSQMTGDYRLKSGSPAIDAATSTVAPAFDFDGTARPVDGDSNGSALDDMGAFEYVPPVAVPESYTMAEDGVLVVSAPGVLANDLGHTLQSWLMSSAHGGHEMLAVDGSFSYTPHADFSGEDHFTYRLYDGSALSNVTTVTITVTPVNDAPVASNDATTCAEDTFARLNLLANDSDVEGDPLTVALVRGPTHGSVALAPSGDATYTPAADFNGTDTFTYKASDGTTESAVATVTITITPLNDAPVATGESFTVVEEGVGHFNVLINDSDVDGDVLQVMLRTSPRNGTLQLDLDSGEATYTPNAHYSGPDSFTYRVDDGWVFSNVATVTITVTAVNDAPVAVDDTATTPEDTLLTVAARGVLANDTDVEGDTLGARLITDVAHGDLALSADGSYTYMPDADWSGEDAFSYVAYDASLDSNVATVTITVTPVNDAPVAVEDTESVIENGSLSVVAPGVLANDADTEGDTPSARLLTHPLHGSVVMSPDGSYTYTPDEDFSGLDTFTYAANDGVSDSNPATVTITVRPLPPSGTSVGRPLTRYVVRRNSRAVVYGYLSPRHTAGSYPVRLRCYHLEDGDWVLRKTVSLKIARNRARNRSKYAGYVKLSLKGRWCVVAVHSHAGYKRDESPPRYLVVR